MVETIVSTIITVVNGIVAGLGSGISDLFTSVFMEGTGEASTISSLGVFILAMFAVSIALFIFRWVMGLIRNRG